MKKRKWIAIALAAALLAGCGAAGEKATGQQETESVYVTDQDPGFSTPSTAGRDMTVQVKTFDTKKYKKQIEKAEPAYAQLCYGFLADSVAELDAHVEQIVRCRVDKTEFMTRDGDAYTKFDVTVLDSYKGDLQANDKISLAIFGGYITEYDFQTERKFSAAEAKAAKNKVVELKSVDYQEEDFPQAGDVYLLGLVKSTLFEGMYAPPAEYSGMWKLGADGKYTRRPNEKAQAGKTYTDNSIESFTLDWFKAELEKTATSE